MKFSLSLAVFSLFSQFLFAQAKVSVSQNVRFEKDTFDIAVFPINGNFINAFTFFENRAGWSERQVYDSLISQGLYFAVNASIVDSAFRPIGLYINRSRKIKQLNNSHQGSGNFYVGTNGFYGFSKDSFYIRESSFYHDSLNLIYGMQSGPLLIKNRVVDPLFKQASKNRNIRCGIGTFYNKRGHFLVFVKSVNPVTFYALANLFKTKYDCQHALTLESGPIVSTFLPASDGGYRDDVFVSNYMLIRL